MTPISNGIVYAAFLVYLALVMKDNYIYSIRDLSNLLITIRCLVPANNILGNTITIKSPAHLRGDHSSSIIIYTTLLHHL